MQEDEFYSKYLERRYSEVTGKTEYVVSRKLAQPLVPDFGLATEIKEYKRASRKPEAARLAAEPVSVHINDLLPRYTELVHALLNAGIKPVETFGSTSEPPLPPETFIITIGRGGPPPVVKGILRLASAYGLAGVNCTPAHESPPFFEMHWRKIYVGSYSYENDSFLKLTPELLGRLLSDKTTDEDFWSLIPETVPRLKPH